MPSTRPDFWTDKFEGNVKRDIRNRDALQASGWSVYVVWECELKADPDGVIQRLSDAIWSG